MRVFKVSVPHTFNPYILQVAPVNIIVGSHVWIEDPGVAWIDGEVVKINGEEVHVQATNGKTVSCLSSFYVLACNFSC